MLYNVLKKTFKFLFSFSLLTSNLTAVNPIQEINLNGIKMNVVKTADNGVVNHETIFIFSQDSRIVSAEYQGGKILKGFLVGTLSEGNQFEFSYCQMQLDGKLDNGISLCQLSKDEDGKLLLIENFEWKSRPGEYGINIFKEI